MGYWEKNLKVSKAIKEDTFAIKEDMAAVKEAIHKLPEKTDLLEMDGELAG